MNINYSTLFPDLGGFCESMSDIFYKDKEYLDRIDKNIRSVFSNKLF